MKKIFFLLLILIATTSQAQVSLGGYIQPLNASPYPVQIDSLGKGGYVVARDTFQRNAIVCLRRKYGMAVYVQSEDKLYILKDSACNNVWSEFTTGSSVSVHTDIDLKQNGNFLLTGNSYNQIQTGSDTAAQFPIAYPGYLNFPPANENSGKRITIVNNDTIYHFPAYVNLGIGTIPLLEGTNKIITCVPFGMTYEFVCDGEFWYATASKQRETRANLLPNLDTYTNGYYLNSCNAIYQFLGFSGGKDVVPIGLINFPPAKYTFNGDTIPINDGQRITIINDQDSLPIAIGENKPYKQYDSDSGFNRMDTIPPSVTYEFVSIGGQWKLATPISQPVYSLIYPSPSPYYNYAPTDGIYYCENVGKIVLPEPRLHKGETIIVVNGGSNSMNIAGIILGSGGGGFDSVLQYSSVTFVSTGVFWVRTSYYAP